MTAILVTCELGAPSSKLSKTHLASPKQAHWLKLNGVVEAAAVAVAFENIVLDFSRFHRPLS